MPVFSIIYLCCYLHKKSAVIIPSFHSRQAPKERLQPRRSLVGDLATEGSQLDWRFRDSSALEVHQGFRMTEIVLWFLSSQMCRAVLSIYPGNWGWAWDISWFMSK